MRYYRVSEDWATYLEGEFRTSLIAKLRSLSLSRLQKFPPPKVTGLPFGNETRILSRFLRGKSSQLDASALSGFYRSMMSSELDLLYRAFRQNEFLFRKEWWNILNEAEINAWIEKKCLSANKDGLLQCQFNVIGLDNLILVTDPLKDHGRLWEPDFIVEGAENNGSSNVQPFFHIYIGLDSLRMIEVMEQGPLPRSGRYLDCGPGSGGLLLYFGRTFDEAVGIDINPRAAALSQFNADLNGLTNIKAYCDDALKLENKYGRFDLISWNLPFIFMPDDKVDRYIDAFGGELGIGLCLDFIQTLPAIMADSGHACVAALAPITNKGENVLEARLRSILPKIGLDCEITVAQVAVADNKELWDFHRSYGLEKFESVYLGLKSGTGKLSRVEAPLGRKLVDRLREKLYRRRYELN